MAISCLSGALLPEQRIPSLFESLVAQHGTGSDEDNSNKSFYHCVHVSYYLVVIFNY
jgi:hypothetical protein